MILGIGVESGVGKDTFAMFLIDHLRHKQLKNVKIIREGFADRLYQLCHTFYGWAGFKSRQHYMVNPKDKEVVLPLTGKCPRQMLIDVSNCLNGFDPNMFLNAVVKDNNHHLKVIPDVRRTWEFEALAKMPDAYLVRITKPGIDSKWEMDQELKTEPYLSRWHMTIENDGDIACLQRKAVEFAEEVVVPRIYAVLNLPLPLSPLSSILSHSVTGS